jgi:hypothetical protein
MKLTTHLHLVPRLRKGGAIPPLPQWIFMVWCLVKYRYNLTFIFPTSINTKTTSFFPLYFHKGKDMHILTNLKNILLESVYLIPQQQLKGI